MDPTPRRGGRVASAARAYFEVIVDGVNSVAIGTAAVETVSLRCKICRGRGGTKGSLRKSGHFVAARAEEHILLHCQPERSQRHALERARKEVSEQKDGASGGEDNRSVGCVTATIAGAPSRSKRPRDGSIVQYTDAWDDVRPRNSRAKLEKFLVGCGIAINVVQNPYFKEFCRPLNEIVRYGCFMKCLKDNQRVIHAYTVRADVIRLLSV
jgi:hypothetical protein